MLGGGDLFGKATEKGFVCVATTTAALGCQYLILQALLFGATLQLASSEPPRDIICHWNLDHTQAAVTAFVGNDKILEHHAYAYAYHRGRHIPRATDRTQPYHHHHSSPTGVESGQHLGIGMAIISLCVRAQRTGRRLHKWNSRACSFYCMQFLGLLARLYNGLRITRKGHNAERGGTGETTFALAHHLFHVLYLFFY